MKDLDAIREDVEIEMAKELSSCRGDVYAEKEALWLALRDERVTKRCIFGDTPITAPLERRWAIFLRTEQELRDKIEAERINRSATQARLIREEEQQQEAMNNGRFGVGA